MKLKDLIRVDAKDAVSFAAEHGLPFNPVQYELLNSAYNILKGVQHNLFPDRYYTRTEMHDFCIAGGSVSRVFRVDPVGGDIDVYGVHSEQYFRSIQYPGRGYRITDDYYTTECSRIKLENHPYTFNFIHASSQDPKLVLATFDFNLVRLAFGPDFALYIHPDAISDLKKREFTDANDSEFAKFYRKTRGNTVKKRAKKYFDMGFTSPDYDFIDFVELPGIPEPKVELTDEDYEFWGKMVMYFRTGNVPELPRPKKRLESAMALLASLHFPIDTAAVADVQPQETATATALHIRRYEEVHDQYMRLARAHNPVQERITDDQALGIGLGNNVPDNGRQGQGPGPVQPQEPDRQHWGQAVTGRWTTDGEPGW